MESKWRRCPAVNLSGSDGQKEEDVGEVTGELKKEEGVEEQSESEAADSNMGSPSSL